MKRMRCPAFYVLPSGMYTLDEHYQAQTFVKGHSVDANDCKLMESGALVLQKGFTWNGPSGPAIDTANTLIPSALHDCGYRLMEKQLISDKTRKNWDRSYRDSLKTWGVNKVRRSMHFRGVDWFGWLWLKK